MLIQKFSRGVNNYFDAVNIQDDEFVQLENVTVARGAIAKKPGTTLLGQLALSTTIAGISTDPSGNYSGTPTYSLGAFSVTFVSIAAGSATFTIGAVTYSDNGRGVLINNITTLPAGTINYTTGFISFSAQAPSIAITGTATVYPGLPVMGISTLQNGVLSFVSVFFDTRYAYGFNSSTRTFFSRSTYSSSGNTVTWNGSNTQQFSTANFQNVLFVTNGVPGMQYNAITSLVASTLPTVTVGVTGHGLVVNDLIFFYQCTGSVEINGLQGTVTSIIDPNTFTATVPALTSLSAYTGGGIIQYLTSQAPSPTIDGIKYYTGTAPTGFVNFAPPLDNSSSPMYLVGCKQLIVYGNRLICLGTYEQKAFGSVTFYPNRIRWCAVLSALYTLGTIQAGPTSTPGDNWWSPPLGSGGFLTLGGNQNISNASVIHETLLIGLEISMRKVVSTNITLLPFIDQAVSTEYGSVCPFCSVVIKNAMLCISNNGITLNTSNDSIRIDETTIPDTVSTIRRAPNGFQQVCAIRDYQSQFIYISFPLMGASFPNRTIVWNYIENNWSFWTEIFTTYGYYLEQGSSRTWATAGTWAQAGTWGQTLGLQGQAQVAAGTPSGAVLLKGGTASFNQPYLLITAALGDVLTIPNHSFTSVMISNGLFLYIAGVAGIVGVVQVMSINGALVTVSGAASAGYISGGLASIADNFLVVTKAYSPNAQSGITQMLKDLFLQVETTEAGVFSVSVFPSFMPPTTQPSPEDSLTTFTPPYAVRSYPDTNLGLTGQQQTQLFNWHRVQTIAQGTAIQLSMYMTGDQMLSSSLPYQQPFVMQGLYLTLSESGALVC
jgi:hypothetical protein